MPDLKKITVGALETNCYVIASGERSLVIDPGDEPNKIAKLLNRNNWKLDYVINTHGHADHIGANHQLKKLGAQILIHPADAEMLTDPQKNLSQFTGGRLLTGPPADKLLQEGDWSWQGKEIKIIHTPGHTPGGICLLWGEWLFSGDTLFAGGVGRTDLPGGNMDDLISSIREKLFKLPGTTRVFPGHGPESTIGFEVENNPFI